MKAEEKHITKEYKNKKTFLNAVIRTLREIIGNDDDLTMIKYGETKTVEERIVDGENVCHNEGMYNYKQGFEIEYPDQIYVFAIEKRR